MSVIPFDQERPFPLRTRCGAPPANDVAARSALMGRALALALRESARNRERARVAEARVEELTAQMMRDQLAEERPSPLPRAG